MLKQVSRNVYHFTEVLKVQNENNQVSNKH